MKKCPSCRSPVSTDWQRCAICGSLLKSNKPNPMRCASWLILGRAARSIKEAKKPTKQNHEGAEARRCYQETLPVMPIYINKKAGEDVVKEITPYLIEVELPEKIVLDSPEVIVTGGKITMEILGWKTIPEVAYKVPILKVEGESLEENHWLGGLIEGEGSAKITHATIRGIRRIIPQFAIHMYDLASMTRASKLLGLKLHQYYDKRREAYEYYIATTGSPAISIAKWILTKANTTPNSRIQKQATQILKTFKQHPTATI